MEFIVTIQNGFIKIVIEDGASCPVCGEVITEARALANTYIYAGSSNSALAICAEHLKPGPRYEKNLDTIAKAVAINMGIEPISNLNHN